MLFVALLFASSVSASAFLGCVNQAAGSTLQYPSTTDLGTCTSTCSASGFSYAYFNSGASKPCACSNSNPPYANFDANTGHTCSVATDYMLYAVSTSFGDTGYCFSNMPTDNAPANPSTIVDCFTSCKAEYVAYISIYSGGIQCRCNSQTVAQGGGGNDQTTTCTNNWREFYHPQSSLGMAKRRREILAARMREAKYCSPGLTACNVADGEGYECIDTSNELESCGGCLYGAFGSSNSTMGADCTKETGVTSFGVTCANGRCNAMACENGYTLVDSKCVRV